MVDSARSPQRLDPATSTGRLMLNMLATLTEHERELIVQLVNAARQIDIHIGRPCRPGPSSRTSGRSPGTPG
jgi:DNA invertase Pin-like site-specific DNA recombinase